MNKIPPKLFAYLLILRWVVALIFFINGAHKYTSPDFGADAEIFFANLRDHVIFKPYVHVINDLVIPQAFIFASIVKYAELILGVAFFIGFPIGLAVFVAIFLHANYLCIADQEYLIYFNVLMIASEFVILHSNSSSNN